LSGIILYRRDLRFFPISTILFREEWKYAAKIIGFIISAYQCSKSAGNRPEG
jgi:hypothetical protein